MTVESWRIDRHKPTSTDFYGVVEFEKGDSDYTVVGRLVPDTRLQAITDAHREFIEASESGDATREADAWENRQDLLDALTEENNDDS